MSDDVHEPEGEKTDKKGKHHVLVGKLQQTAVKAQIKGQFRHTGKKKEPQGILLTVGGGQSLPPEENRKWGRKFFLLTGVSGLPDTGKRWFRSPRQKKAVGCKRKLRRFPEKQLQYGLSAW